MSFSEDFYLEKHKLEENIINDVRTFCNKYRVEVFDTYINTTYYRDYNFDQRFCLPEFKINLKIIDDKGIQNTNI